MRSEAILKHVKGPKVLDVGCTGHVVKFGSSDWLHGRLRDIFEDVTGTDISEQNLQLLKDHGYDKLYLQSAENLELPERYDTIVAGELVEHLANPGKFLERAKNHLAEGGRIVISTPYVFSLLYILYATFKYPKTCQNQEHAAWFCLQTVKSLTERTGLAISHFELVEDYDPKDASGTYRTFVSLIRIFRPLIPARMRKNVMLFTLTPAVARSSVNEDREPLPMA